MKFTFSLCAEKIMCQHFVIRRRRAPPRQSRGTAAGRGQPQDRANLDQPLIPVYATDDAQPHPTEPSSHQRQPHGSGDPLGEQPRKHRHTQQTDNTSTTARSAVQESISSRRSRANRTAAVPIVTGLGNPSSDRLTASGFVDQDCRRVRLARPGFQTSRLISAGRQGETCRRWSGRFHGHDRRGCDRGIGALDGCVHVSEGQHDQHENPADQQRPERPQGRHDRGTAGSGVVRRPAATPTRCWPVREAGARPHVGAAQTPPACMPSWRLDPHNRSMTLRPDTLARPSQRFLEDGLGRDQRPAA